MDVQLQPQLVRLLLENGANFNAEGGAFGTALSAASSNSSEEVVRLLLENGLDIYAQSGRVRGEALKMVKNWSFKFQLLKNKRGRYQLSILR